MNGFSTVGSVFGLHAVYLANRAARRRVAWTFLLLLALATTLAVSSAAAVAGDSSPTQGGKAASQTVLPHPAEKSSPANPPAAAAAATGKPSADERLFRAGAGVVDITPRTLPVIVNGGFTERRIDQITDRLHVRALALDDGANKAVIAVVDSCLVPRALLDEAKRRAAEATGVPVERMLISATHTHSAPSVAGALGSEIQRDYAEQLPIWIAEAIEKAVDNLQPAHVGWAVLPDPRNVFCRRFRMKPGTAPTNPFSGKSNDQAQMNPGHQNPNAIERTGPVDPDVSVLCVRSRDGRPLALLANYSTHYAGAPGISADYFGEFCRLIDEKWNTSRRGDFTALMTNGTSGDANCIDFVHPPRTFNHRTVAADVAETALKAVAEAKWFDWVPLVMIERKMTLNVRMPSQEEVDRAGEVLAAMGDRLPRTLVEVYARETVLLHQMPPTRELKLQVIRLGGLGIVAIPCEVFGSTGLAIKAKSPLKPTFNISLANGAEGYIAPPEQHALGGYTTWRARSSCLEEQAEPNIRDAILEMLDEAAKQRADELPIPVALPDSAKSE